MQHGALMLGQKQLLIELEHELHGEIALALGLRIENVDADRPIHIRGIEQHDPLEHSAVVRTASENRGDEIPVRVEHAARATRTDVIENEMQQKCGLSHAGQTRDVGAELLVRPKREQQLSTLVFLSGHEGLERLFTRRLAIPALWDKQAQHS